MDFVKCEDCLAKEKGICPWWWEIDLNLLEELHKQHGGFPCTQVKTHPSGEDTTLIGCGIGIAK